MTIKYLTRYLCLRSSILLLTNLLCTFNRSTPTRTASNIRKLKAFFGEKVWKVNVTAEIRFTVILKRYIKTHKLPEVSLREILFCSSDTTYR